MTDKTYIQDNFIKVLNENKKIIRKVCDLYANDRQDLEDLYQDIVLQLWKSFKSFKGQSGISTWIYRIAINTAITRLRLNYKKPVSGKLEHNTIDNAVAEDNSIKNERIERLNEAMKKLNDIEKAIILLYLDKNSYQEIAKITGITLTNVATRISRIKHKLRNYMTNH